MTIKTPERAVAKERTGWRDEDLSRRHREWGYDCPAVDLDFLLVEFDQGRPVAIVEYKHERAAPVREMSANFRALRELADRANVHFLYVRYAGDFSRWQVAPMNRIAVGALGVTAKDYLVMNEEEYVALLHRLRDEARGPKPDPALQYYAFLASKPCIKCDARGVEVAHVRTIISPKTGQLMGRSHKSSSLSRWGAVPLCPDCHRHARDSIHSVGEAAFAEDLGRGQHFLFQKAASLMAEFMEEAL